MLGDELYLSHRQSLEYAFYRHFGACVARSFTIGQFEVELAMTQSFLLELLAGIS